MKMEIQKMMSVGKTAMLFSSMCVVVAALTLWGQGSSQVGNTDQIKSLMQKISDHSVNAADILDSKLNGPDRKKSLEYFSDPGYQLSWSNIGEIKIQDGLATVPARIHFKNATGELDSDVDVRFVQREGTWYFADFNFLGWPAILVVAMVICMGVAISYGICAVTLQRRLLKQGRLNAANLIKTCIPLFWPNLFSEIRKEPPQ